MTKSCITIIRSQSSSIANKIMAMSFNCYILNSVLSAKSIKTIKTTILMRPMSPLQTQDFSSCLQNPNNLHCSRQGTSYQHLNLYLAVRCSLVTSCICHLKQSYFLRERCQCCLHSSAVFSPTDDDSCAIFDFENYSKKVSFSMIGQGIFGIANMLPTLVR